MDQIDMMVLGGPHHGETHVVHREQLALPIKQPMPDDIRDLHGKPAAEPIPPQAIYRHEKFYDPDHVYHVWIPDDVPKDRVMLHVLELAAKAPAAERSK